MLRLLPARTHGQESRPAAEDKAGSLAQGKAHNEGKVRRGVRRSCAPERLEVKMMHWTSSDQKIPEEKWTSASSFEICCPAREVAQTCQGGYPNPAIEGELAVQNVCGAVYG